MIDFRCAFPGKIYELLEFAKIFYIGFRLRLGSSQVARKGAPLRSVPSSSAVDDADDTRERVPASIFNIASTAHLQDPRLHGANSTSLECMSLFATLSAIRRLPHRFLCGYTYWNAISWIEVKYLNRCLARKDTLSRHSIHSFVVRSIYIILYNHYLPSWKIYF